MYSSIFLIYAVMQKYGLDYAGVARMLNITRGAINNILNHRVNFAIPHAILLAKKLDLDTTLVVASIQHDKAKTDIERNFWRNLFYTRKLQIEEQTKREIEMPNNDEIKALHITLTEQRNKMYEERIYKNHRYQ